MHRWLDAFDARVGAAADSIRSPALDRIAYRLSSAADHSLLWFVAGAARSIRTGDLRFVVRFSAAMSLESALTNGLVKAMFRRTRPAPPSGSVPLPDALPYGMRRPITSSFPSGHATAAFTAAALLAERRRAPWYALAGAVAATRVYVRMHHASDVIGGAVLGAALGHTLRPWVRRARH
jgi:undecaprenyl-diphosphatase